MLWWLVILVDVDWMFFVLLKVVSVKLLICSMVMVDGMLVGYFF